MTTRSGRRLLLVLLLGAGAIRLSAQDFLAWSSTNHLPGVQIISGLFAGQKAIVLQGKRGAFADILICYTDEIAANCEAASVLIERLRPSPPVPATMPTPSTPTP